MGDCHVRFCERLGLKCPCLLDFLNRQRTTVKIFVYEDKGFSIFYRRLDEGSLQLPLISSDHISYKMTTDQIMYMLSGMTLEDGGYMKAPKYEPLHGSLP